MLYRSPENVLFVSKSGSQKSLISSKDTKPENVTISYFILLTIHPLPFTNNTAYLLTGSNMGSPQAMLHQAANAIVKSGIGKITAASSLYQTAAWGKKDQPDFLNQALQIQTAVSPQDLLAGLLAIEKQMGRKRFQKNDPRIIDLDILFYNNIVLHTPNLVIPHPLLQVRRFVLVPLAEIAPDLVHPVLQKSVAELLETCADTLHVNKFSEAR